MARTCRAYLGDLLVRVAKGGEGGICPAAANVALLVDGRQIW